MSESENKPFKNWFDKAAALALAKQVSAVHSDFDEKKFVRLCCRQLDTLEFNARVSQFADALAQTLPTPYPKAVRILKDSLPEVLPNSDSVTDGWLQWPLGQFVADHGVDHFDDSMRMMVEHTQRFSSEYAVRPFVEKYPDKTFAYLYKKLNHKSEHVRRWCSEGCRTRLPWGIKLNSLIADPAPIIPILDALKDDPALYVRKSVANNLNDLAKDHPAMVTDICRDWSKDSNPNRDWVIRHGLRSLIKAGDKKALNIIGFKKPTGVVAVLSLADSKVTIGESVNLRAELSNTSKQKRNLLVDYIVHFQGKNNAVRQKVFKWKTLSLPAGDKVVLEKKHPMKLTTIRALYSGKHQVELQINGEIVAAANFQLTQ